MHIIKYIYFGFGLDAHKGFKAGRPHRDPWRPCGEPGRSPSALLRALSAQRRKRMLVSPLPAGRAGLMLGCCSRRGGSRSLWLQPSTGLSGKKQRPSGGWSLLSPQVSLGGRGAFVWWGARSARWALSPCLPATNPGPSTRIVPRGACPPCWNLASGIWTALPSPGSSAESWKTGLLM